MRQYQLAVPAVPADQQFVRTPISEPAYRAVCWYSLLVMSDLLEKTKRNLRSVLISEKGGVAADRLERDYRDLVSLFTYTIYV